MEKSKDELVVKRVSAFCLVLFQILSCSNGFIVQSSPTNQNSWRPYFAQQRRLSSLGEGSNNSEDLVKETKQRNNGPADKKSTPSKLNRSNSILYYDKRTTKSLDKREKKKQEMEQRQIAVYHNILEKNANDCSVCTVPDKIDASKIVSSTKTQSNGVTPGNKTMEKSLLDIKKQVNGLIQEPSVELADGLLILASSLMVALSTVPSVPPTIMSTIYFFQDVTVGLFAFGFLTRWWSSLQPRGTYFEDPLEWVDLAVVVLPFLFLTVPGLADLFPSWLTSQTALINLRLLRVLRFQRILQDEFTFSRFVSGLRIPGSAESCVIVELWQLQLARVLLSIFTLLSVASGLIYSAEHTVNPGIDNYFSALYFGLTTLTTVGFGDITPMTWQGKLVVSGSILAGVAILPAQAGALVEALLARGADEPLSGSSTSSTTINSASRRPLAPSSNSMGKNLVLETTQTCPSCQAGLHWAQANFCYNCGEKISIKS